MLNAPKKYHESNNLQVTATAQLLKSVKDQILNKNLDPAKLIDIGTGDGRVLVEVFVKLSGIKFSKITGSDRRKDVVDFAQETYGSDLINFEVLDIEHASEKDIQKVLKSGQFSIGTSFWCLQFALDHERTFSNINKLLMPGGSFYFNFLGHYSFVDIHFKLAEKYPELKDAIFDQLPLLSKDINYKEKLPEILCKTGFDIDFLRFEAYEHDFGNEACFRDTLSSSLPYLYGLEKEYLEKVMNDYVAINEELFGSSGKNIFSVTFTCVHGLITKNK